MIGFIRKLFGGSTPPSHAVVDGTRQAESIDALYEEFCRTFCHKPGVNFMDFLKTEGITRMIDWLRPVTPCALPKGFIRLAINATRKGENIWEKPGISMLYEGNWDHGGVPGRESSDAVSVLAQILGIPIKLFYRTTPDGELMVMKFEP
jgi:hypothetical protein